jgi:hypothetical protein
MNDADRIKFAQEMMNVLGTTEGTTRELMTVLEAAKDQTKTGLLGIYFEARVMHDTINRIAEHLGVNPRFNAVDLLGEFRNMTMAALLSAQPPQSPPESSTPRF